MKNGGSPGKVNSPCTAEAAVRVRSRRARKGRKRSVPAEMVSSRGPFACGWREVAKLRIRTVRVAVARDPS